jgi:hypothetical protein
MFCLKGDRRVQYDKDSAQDSLYYEHVNRAYPQGCCGKFCYSPWLQTPKLIFYGPKSTEHRIIFPYNLEQGKFQ